MPELEVRCRTRIFRTCPKGLQWRDNSYANGRSWVDVAWDVFVFDRVSDGLTERRFTNMRMALSAHLEGRDERPFLIVLGAIWGHVELPPRVEEGGTVVGALRHVWQLAVYHARCRDGYRRSQPNLVAGPSRKTMAGKGGGGGLSQRHHCDLLRRGADSVRAWPPSMTDRIESGPASQIEAATDQSSSATAVFVHASPLSTTSVAPASR